MRYFRPLGAVFMTAMLAGVAWGQEGEKKEPAAKENEKAEQSEHPRLDELHKLALEKFDADKDGKLNDEERAKAREYHQKLREEIMHEWRERGGPPRGPRPPRGPGRGPEGRGPEGRGPEERAERGPDGPGPGGPPPAMRLFERFDENHDGRLSREEFEKLAGRMRQMGPPPGRGPGGPDGPRGWGRAGRLDGPDAGPEGGPARRRGDFDRGPERRRPRPPRDDDDDRGREDNEHEHADRPHHEEGDKPAADVDKPKGESAKADKSTI
jgi:hypothetical protein